MSKPGEVLQTFFMSCLYILYKQFETTLNSFENFCELFYSFGQLLGNQCVIFMKIKNKEFAMNT